MARRPHAPHLGPGQHVHRAPAEACRVTCCHVTSQQISVGSATRVLHGLLSLAGVHRLIACAQTTSKVAAGTGVLFVPLNASPGDHDAVVCAEPWRRCYELKSSNSGQVAQPLLDYLVAGHTTCRAGRVTTPQDKAAVMKDVWPAMMGEQQNLGSCANPLIVWHVQCQPVRLISYSPESFTGP